MRKSSVAPIHGVDVQLISTKDDTPADGHARRPIHSPSHDDGYEIREMSSGESPWSAGAGYLYVLHLDATSLAWEYLRRNPDYRADWPAHAADHSSSALRWGLGSQENPGLDARDAQPLWRPRPEGELRIIPLEEASGGALRFDLWALPGHKVLCHDGRHLILNLVGGSERVRIAVDLDLGHGMAFGYVVPAGFVSTWQAARRADLLMPPRGERTFRVVATAASRDAIVHMRTLQALDGVRAGASQRNVAAVLFGADRVIKEWAPDSELRARTRHYVRRGRALMSGEYRRLLQPSAARDTAVRSSTTSNSAMHPHHGKC
ncbi:MAG: DUF2285 domain-containing protein [Casimicrobiaceae bacterium]